MERNTARLSILPVMLLSLAVALSLIACHRSNSGNFHGDGFASDSGNPTAPVANDTGDGSGWHPK